MTYANGSVTRTARLFLALAVALTAGGLWLGLPKPGPQLLAFLLFAIWPAVSWAGLLSGPPVERALIAAATAVLLNTALTLVLVYLPGPTSGWMLLLAYALAALLPLASPRFALRFSVTKADWREIWPVLLIVGLTLGLRWVHLGYSEYQGDESVIMIRAARILAGEDAQLFLHQKGPVEILIPLGIWGMVGEINELWSRVLFTWASCLSVTAVWLLAHRWFRRPVGEVTAVLFAISGFSVAFARIVQYQSLVMLWGTLAVLLADRYARENRRTDLALTAVLLAGGLLAHYDAILVVPAIAWLLVGSALRARRLVWRDWLVAGTVGLFALCLFYVPFVLDPNFARTGQYLLRGRIGASEATGILRWSGAQVWQMVTFYNSTYYVLGLILLVLAGLGTLWGRRRRGEMGDGGTAVLFFITPLLFYLFIVVDPRTHVYTFFPGAAVLAGVGATAVGDWLRRQRLRPLGIVALGLFTAVSAYYIWLMFVDHMPERQRTWAENQPRFYPTTWDEPPLYGIFGFPHQAGWRLAEEMVQALPYASNEERVISDWYMSQATHTYCPDFATFVQVASPQDAMPYDAALLDGLPAQGQVMVNGREGMTVYGRDPASELQVREAAGSALWRTPEDVLPSRASGQMPLDITLGNQQVRLLGYDLDSSAAFPGGQVTLTLYWQALTPFTQNYQVFTHLISSELLAQHDGPPECGMVPTTHWLAGEIIRDPHVIELPPDLPLGQMQLWTGMYNLITQERLPRADKTADSIYLTEITIR
jgi:hypothetical protein